MVSNTVVTTLALCVTGGGVATTPAVGMSPAKAAVDSTHVRISAKAIRFMEFAPI